MVIPFAVPHATTCDVDLEGFNLPEGTAVYANVWHVMHNKEYWDRPEEFLPERFLDPETGAFRKDERCIPFMLGKRLETLKTKKGRVKQISVLNCP